MGFRCWLAGYQTGDIACWEQAWSVFARDLGAAKAKTAITDLSCWVRVINNSTQRRIEIYPSPCSVFCKDECLAVSMVAASQHDLCPALRACAFALVEITDIQDVVASTLSFGDTLRQLDIVLSPRAVVNATGTLNTANDCNH